MFPSLPCKMAKSETSDFASILSEAGEKEYLAVRVRDDKFGVE